MGQETDIWLAKHVFSFFETVEKLLIRGHIIRIA